MGEKIMNQQWGWHHQTGSTGVHVNKAQFEKLYGSQESLLMLVGALLGGLFTQGEILELHKGNIRT